MHFDPQAFRRQFPALTEDIIYLDSAATAMTPLPVIEAMDNYYCLNRNSVHRSHHQTGQDLNQQFDQTRTLAAAWLNAASSDEIIWTRNTTEALNLVAQSWARSRLQAGDELLVSEAEHNANLLPWLMVAQQCGARVVKLPLNRDYLPDIANIERYLSPRTRILALGQMSNVTGGAPDLAAAINAAHSYGAIVVVDGAQGIVHQRTDVQALDIDFYAFSAHKLYGPTGIGVLYGKSALLESMPPWQGGGMMLEQVDFNGFVPLPPPARFEAGTPNIAGVIGLNACFSWLRDTDWHQAENWARSLADEAQELLATLPGFRTWRAPGSCLLAFNFDHIHHSDLASLLNASNIALRAGQHCAHTLLQALGVPGTLRVSFAPYNNRQDVHVLYSDTKDALALLTD
ncbi:MAG: cysteine desulfurase CsdA [Enterobacteriaceae bacterium]